MLSLERKKKTAKNITAERHTKTVYDLQKEGLHWRKKNVENVHLKLNCLSQSVFKATFFDSDCLFFIIGQEII